MTKGEWRFLANDGLSGGTDRKPSAAMRRLERRGLMTIVDKGDTALLRYYWRLTKDGEAARARAREICDDCGHMTAEHAIEQWGPECP